VYSLHLQSIRAYSPRLLLIPVSSLRQIPARHLQLIPA
jgi:hypothetical protein